MALPMLPLGVVTLIFDKAISPFPLSLPSPTKERCQQMVDYVGYVRFYIVQLIIVIVLDPLAAAAHGGGGDDDDDCGDDDGARRRR